MSVQLLSPEELACTMVNDYYLLYLMLISLNGMLQRVLTSSDMNGKYEVIDLGFICVFISEHEDEIPFHYATFTRNVFSLYGFNVFYL